MGPARCDGWMGHRGASIDESRLCYAVLRSTTQYLPIVLPTLQITVRSSYKQGLAWPGLAPGERGGWGGPTTETPRGTEEYLSTTSTSWRRWARQNSELITLPRALVLLRLIHHARPES